MATERKTFVFIFHSGIIGHHHHNHYNHCGLELDLNCSKQSEKQLYLHIILNTPHHYHLNK
ncbi:hypothetical protein DERP_011553 [Dermatophagoides pteronyssinus]|uniref:Uncharacterized protein n=1 Tax=Dermatophagoides pteronyssinus TaxID=6956 RepID=A0ABQ8JC69_DERPT|nr:hypothetical protein DERP_011553 [Dermatophagoides pteronyssinus]